MVDISKEIKKITKQLKKLEIANRRKKVDKKIKARKKRKAKIIQKSDDLYIKKLLAIEDRRERQKDIREAIERDKILSELEAEKRKEPVIVEKIIEKPVMVEIEAYNPDILLRKLDKQQTHKLLSVLSNKTPPELGYTKTAPKSTIKSILSDYIVRDKPLINRLKSVTITEGIEMLENISKMTPTDYEKEHKEELKGEGVQDKDTLEKIDALEKQIDKTQIDIYSLEGKQADLYSSDNIGILLPTKKAKIKKEELKNEFIELRKQINAKEEVLAKLKEDLDRLINYTKYGSFSLKGEGIWNSIKHLVSKSKKEDNSKSKKEDNSKSKKQEDDENKAKNMLEKRILRDRLQEEVRRMKKSTNQNTNYQSILKELQRKIDKLNRQLKKMAIVKSEGDSMTIVTGDETPSIIEIPNKNIILKEVTRNINKDLARIVDDYVNDVGITKFKDEGEAMQYVNPFDEDEEVLKKPTERDDEDSNEKPETRDQINEILEPYTDNDIAEIISGYFEDDKDFKKDIWKTTKHLDGRGQSGGAKDGGLYENQINDRMKGCPIFKKCIASDEINTLTPSKIMAFIMNTQPRNKEGQHWVACYIDTIKDKVVEYYDPLGDPPIKNFSTDIMTLVNKLKPKNMLKYKVNSVANQDGSDNCGEHCMKFINDRFAGKSFVDTTGFKEIKNQSNVSKKEAELKKFGYI